MRALAYHGVGRTSRDEVLDPRHPSPLVTQTFPLPQMLDADDVFARAADTGALKVVCKKP